MTAPSNATDVPSTRQGDRRWPIALAMVALAAFCVNTLAFWPGFMTPDSLDQLNQARGGSFTDWHPPILALLWRGLIGVTGSIASMLVLQLLVEWTALWGLATLVHRHTLSRRWSLTVLAFGVLPFVVNISGVIWKDVHMAIALFAAVVLTLWLPQVRSRRVLFLVLVALVILLLAYAVLVRKNAVVAVLPLLFTLHLSWPTPKVTQGLALLAVLVATVLGLQTMVNLVAQPAVTGMSQFIAVDDIVHTMTAEEIRDAGFSSDLERRLLETQEVCQRDDIIFDAYVRCYPMEEGVNHGPETQDRWLGLMAQRPITYLNYRLEGFSTYLFNYRNVWVDGVYPNEEGITPRNPRLAKSLYMYVSRTDLSLGIVFVPAVWLLVSFLLIVRRSAGSAFSPAARMLGLSSFLYIAAYFPVVPATDYRYTYWPVLACCLAGVLLLSDRGRADQTAGAEAE